VVVLSLAVGYAIVWSRLALFDDAYISFRYARNFAEGLGLVWNPGERVEGYTNFLWTLAVGLAVRATSWPAPQIGLWGCLAIFGASLLVAAALSRRLAGARWVPLAVPFLALHPVFTGYGSSGLETGLCALLVLLLAWALAVGTGPRAAALAGLAGIAAALTRPDHGLFYAVGAAVVAWEAARGLASGEARPREALARCAAYAAPFALYAAYLVWKLDYYGDLLPNTYYAKSADRAWWSQGARYAFLFWGPGLAAVPLVLAAAGALRPETAARRRFAAFALGSVAVYVPYVVRVGGDFMHGRFFVSLLPLVAIGAEGFVHRLARSEGRRRRLGALAAGAALLLSARPPDLFEGRERIWGINDQNAYWPVVRVRPEIVVDREHYRLGRFFHDELEARGLTPVIGTGGIGMVGYYSGLPLVDSRGLTDPVVARQPLEERTRPGHEKQAPREYLVSRGVRLLRLPGGQRDFHPKRFRGITRFDLSGAGIDDPWQIATYDRALMRRIRDEVPGVRFTDFERWLDRYLVRLPETHPTLVRRDLPWLDRYYFDHNDDEERRAPIAARAAIVRLPPAPARGG